MRPIEDEVSILRRRMQVVESRLDNTRARDALPSLATNARLARVTNSTPEGDNYNLYAIKFLDGDFPDTTGSITVDYTDRQVNTAAYVCNVTGARIPQNTVILAYWWSNRWWTSYSTGAENEMALVRVAGSEGIPSCNNVGPSAPSIYPGKLVTVDTNQAFNTNDAYIDGADVWLLEVTHCMVVSSLKQQERFIGRKIGQYTIGGETRDLYQIKTSSESTPTSGEVHHILLCDGTPDLDCCVYDAIKLVYTPKTVTINGTTRETYCTVDVDREKVWVRCANGSTFNLPNGYCKLGVKINDALTCRSETRPVYMFDCGGCVPCRCPYGCDEIDFEMHADGTACESLYAGLQGKLKCLDDVPWAPPSPGANPRPGWWGEFTVAGVMPRFIYTVQIECDVPDPNGSSGTVREERAAWGEVDCGGLGGDAGHIIAVYEDDGLLTPFSGQNCIYKTGLIGCDVMLDEQGEYQFLDRTYRIGVWVECISDPVSGTFDRIDGPWFIWLMDDEIMGIAGIFKSSVNPECDDTTPEGTPCIGTGTGDRLITDDFCAIWGEYGPLLTGDCCANSVTQVGTVITPDCYQFRCADPNDTEATCLNNCIPIAELQGVDLTGENGIAHCPRCELCCQSLLGCWWCNAGDPCSPDFSTCSVPQISCTVSWPIRGLFDVPTE